MIGRKKMRLIDADKLKLEQIARIQLGEMQEYFALYSYSKNQIEEAPAVEAIPIDWLMQKADEYANTNITYADEPYQFTAQEIALAIALLVREWRIENETKTD